MNRLSTEEAKKLLTEEYSFLTDANLTIKHQFKTAKGRVFNTFLVESTKPGFERFVAKGVGHQQSGLDLEWKVLAILQQNEADAPKLLLPNHKPQHFLLLKHIEGENAAKVVDKNEQKVFYEVGIALGKLHSIPVGNFGDLLSPQNISWKEYLENKISERLEGVKDLIPETLYVNTKRLFHSLNPIVEVEASEEPRLIHRDIYLENFILNNRNNKATLIDYGMAIGGRPF